mmetsp:Transcript_79779/g.158041  ORF Transcript_79779/g.158041 Transcript_79779/m.158041 type:complete len:232 (-) Transcript_79779:768-1463(-)
MLEAKEVNSWPSISSPKAAWVSAIFCSSTSSGSLFSETCCSHLSAVPRNCISRTDCWASFSLSCISSMRSCTCAKPCCMTSLSFCALFTLVAMMLAIRETAACAAARGFSASLAACVLSTNIGVEAIVAFSTSISALFNCSASSSASFFACKRILCLCRTALKGASFFWASLTFVCISESSSRMASLVPGMSFRTCAAFAVTQRLTSMRTALAALADRSVSSTTGSMASSR